MIFRITNATKLEFKYYIRYVPAYQCIKSNIVYMNI